MDKNFWKRKKLSEFSEEEWEASCMRCGKCCLEKITNDGHIFFSNQMCDGFDFQTSRCTRYATRLCADCVKVDFNLLQSRPELLPETCAYRLLFDGKELPDYHPLVSGNENSVHQAGKSVLSMPIVSCVERRKAEQALMRDSGDLPDEAFRKRCEQLEQLYPYVFLESYPIPEKKL